MPLQACVAPAIHYSTTGVVSVLVRLANLRRPSFYSARAKQRTIAGGERCGRVKGLRERITHAVWARITPLTVE